MNFYKEFTANYPRNNTDKFFDIIKDRKFDGGAIIVKFIVEDVAVTAGRKSVGAPAKAVEIGVYYPTEGEGKKLVKVPVELSLIDSKKGTAVDLVSAAEQMLDGALFAGKICIYLFVKSVHIHRITSLGILYNFIPEEGIRQTMKKNKNPLISQGIYNYIYLMD